MVERNKSENQDPLALAALCFVPELGPVTVRKLIRTFGSAGAALAAPMGRLMEVAGVGDKRAASIAEHGGSDSMERLSEKCEELAGEGARLVTEDSTEYPGLLRELGQYAPPVIFIKGDYIEDDRFSLAIVGSRKATPYGLGVAERISTDLARMGITIISGLARGVDSAAHKSALASGGRSIGVLGSGIDVPYPREHRGLMARMAGDGCVISEFAPGMEPLRENFPRRNRLISGLSLGVLVVEAAGQSGALITAGYALEQGREVFSVPGNINSLGSMGTNELIRRGASVVTSAEDIIRELGPVLKGFMKKSHIERQIELSDFERPLYDIMSTEPMHVDAIGRACGKPAAETLAVLLTLELKGVIKQTEGKRFHII